MEVSVNVLQNVNLEIVNRTEVNQGPVAKVSACISLWKKYNVKVCGLCSLLRSCDCTWLVCETHDSNYKT